eukprot:m.355331 g.355331  ORF g.355331 m.355331 type:complete len:410 (+) comp17222_c0_seq1:214-1443(+)
MVLESTVICLDSSEYTRNGDFVPTRLGAQTNAANLVSRRKIDANPESKVAVMTLAKKRQVLTTLGKEKELIAASLFDVKSGGEMDLINGLKVASLILKHGNKGEGATPSKRIVAFVASPITAEETELVSLAKKLKKSNVNVDIVSFGESDENQAKLEAFINAVNKSNESHLVVVPAGAQSLTDSVIASPVLSDGGQMAGMGAAAGGGGASLEETDPELAMALRLSLEEEQARQARTTADEPAAEGGAGMETAEDDDDELQAALRMSMGTATEESAAEPTETPAQPAAASKPGPNLDAMTEDEMLQYALQMSMTEGMDATEDSPAADTSAAATDSTPAATSVSAAVDSAMDESPEEPAQDATPAFADSDFLSSVLGSLPGVDPNDPSIQSLVQSVASPKKDADKEEKDKK